jgi:hypothetical protein
LLHQKILLSVAPNQIQERAKVALAQSFPTCNGQPRDGTPFVVSPEGNGHDRMTLEYLISAFIKDREVG